MHDFESGSGGDLEPEDDSWSNVFMPDFDAQIIDLSPHKSDASDEYANRIPNPYTTLLHQGKGTEYPSKHHIS